jgi:diketogulonate reductase-like aldo/keto reductase
MMQTKPFGKTGVDVAVIGQGTWDVPESGSRAAEARDALRCGIDLGMTHIDTAEMYGNGRVEELLCDAIAGYPRESLFVATKVLPGNAHFRGTIAAAERSLKRMGLDHVDLYMLHWAGHHPLEETMRALERLVHDGKTRFVGVSNFDADEMLEAAELLESVPLACNQVLYHLNERGAEHRVIPTARRHGIAVVAYTPFGRGRFPGPAGAGGAVLAEVAKKHGATPRQIILAFLTREPNVFTIPKASRVEHVRENAAAAELTLDAEDVAKIEAAFPRGEPAPLASL